MYNVKDACYVGLLRLGVTIGKQQQHNKKKLCIIEVANSKKEKKTHFPCSSYIVCDLISTWLRGFMQCLYMRDP